VKLDVALVARHSHFGKPRHLSRRADEARIAASSAPAARNHDARVRLREVGDQIAAVEHLCADWNAHLDGLAVGSVLPCAGAVATLARLDRAAPLQIREIAERRVRDEDDIAAVAGVTAVRAALRNEFLATERQAAVAAAAGLDVKLRAVAERG
jgi:hypothetical protein